MSMVILRFCLIFQRCKDQVCKKENGLYLLVCLHCKYSSSQRFETVVIWLKWPFWADTVLKSRHGQFQILLTFSKMYGVQDRKCFLSTSLLLLRTFEWSKISKYCFRTKITHLSIHSFKSGQSQS